MELLDCFYQRDIPVIDRCSFVFDERDPRTGYYTMLATSETGGDALTSAFRRREEGGANDRESILGPAPPLPPYSRRALMAREAETARAFTLSPCAAVPQNQGHASTGCG